MWVEVGTEPEHDLLFRPFPLPANGSKDRHVQVRCQIDYPDIPAQFAKNFTQSARVGIRKTVQVDCWTANPGVPPECNTVPFDQFQESLQDGFLKCVPRRVPV